MNDFSRNKKTKTASGRLTAVKVHELIHHCLLTNQNSGFAIYHVPLSVFDNTMHPTRRMGPKSRPPRFFKMAAGTNVLNDHEENHWADGWKLNFQTLSLARIGRGFDG